MTRKASRTARGTAAAIAVAFAALMLTAPAEARDGCDRGWFWNGFACVPQYAGPPGYAPRRVYGPSPHRPIYGESNFGRPEVWFRPYVDRRGRLQCAQRGYTVQDGYCKRYRGY